MNVQKRMVNAVAALEEARTNIETLIVEAGYDWDDLLNKVDSALEIIDSEIPPADLLGWS